MRKYLNIIALAACFAGMVICIEWSKEAVKAFISGGVIVWAARSILTR